MKKNCEEILELLKNGYLDNEFASTEREEINLHLERCSACRSTKENLAAISCALRNAPRVNPPENLWPRIQKEIRPISVPRVKPAADFSVTHFKYFFTKRNSFALAAAALVLMAVGFHFAANRQDDDATAPSLSALIGNDEMHEPNLNFGSAIEKHFL